MSFKTKEIRTSVTLNLTLKSNAHYGVKTSDKRLDRMANNSFGKLAIPESSSEPQTGLESS